MQRISYDRHRFPPEVIRHAIWPYLRFTLSFRDVEELLAERGIEVSYETIRRWVLKFGPLFAESCGGDVLGRARNGISTRWPFRSAASGSGSGEPWTARARCSTCWSSRGATRRLP